MNRPNYFELLGLDPSDVLDLSVIEDTIEAARQKWHSPMSVQEQEFRQYRGMLPDIARVMNDPLLRAEEENTYRANKEAAQISALESAGEQLLLISRARPVSEADLESIGKQPEYRGILTPNQLRQRARELHIDVIDEDKQRGNESKTLSPDVVKRIREKLGSIGKPDLYDFLGIANDAPLVRLKNAATNVVEECRRHRNRTPEIQTKEELATECLVIFGSPEQRTRYDESLQLIPIDELLQKAEILVDKRSRCLTTEAVEILLEIARQKDVSEEDFVKALIREATNQGWVVEISELRSHDVVRCPVCDTENPWHYAYCKRDYIPLHGTVKCGVCKAKTPVNGLCCRSCGSRLEQEVMG